MRWRTYSDASNVRISFANIPACHLVIFYQVSAKRSKPAVVLLYRRDGEGDERRPDGKFKHTCSYTTRILTSPVLNHDAYERHPYKAVS